MPKAVSRLKRNPKLFSNEDEAMVSLGVGKNMVRSIRFWAETAGIIEPLSDQKGYTVNRFGEELLGHDGHDQFLEHPATLWLLHWKIATNPTAPIYQWVQMLNRWHRAEFTEGEAMAFLTKNLPGMSRTLSARTNEDGLRVFINTYIPTRGRKGEVAEDNLDSPFVELGLLRRCGERSDVKTGQREPIYSFAVEDKPTISTELFAYCLNDFWLNEHAKEGTISFGAVAVGEGSPGQVFKLPEASVRHYLDQIKGVTQGAMTFEESASLQQVTRSEDAESFDFLEKIYLPA
ncbi:hypothetical protein BGE01nite_37430 [Brevifollis gellanilyticus]|uniref:DUF4007 domain-containing protein n=1 Tax=Brevifollis gellanilyticus TaxID=748831 RepID=A0A512MCL8_9BACT|nr:hypothetical protein BGE01nite_37430 [Brevifollis gellanilyticus]